MSMMSHSDLDIIKDEIKNDFFYIEPCDMEQNFYLQIFDKNKTCIHQFIFSKEQAKEFFNGIGSALQRTGIVNNFSIK